jgi:hypothetical protein
MNIWTVPYSLQSVRKVVSNRFLQPVCCVESGLGNQFRNSYTTQLNVLKLSFETDLNAVALVIHKTRYKTVSKRQTRKKLFKRLLLVR